MPVKNDHSGNRVHLSWWLSEEGNNPQTALEYSREMGIFVHDALSGLQHYKITGKYLTQFL